tara:strand:+ start:49617 stop:49832 length:216 start_codon:yes stop_codon:yes gene_type:complete
MTRKFLHKELDEVAIMYSPSEVSIDSFVEDIQGSLEAWANNMKNLKYKNVRYPEQHMECFLAWAEFNTKDE